MVNTLRTALRERGNLVAVLMLLPILLCAWGLRSVHRNDWDGFAFLIHPDEYHVGDRVTMALRVPNTFGDYLRSECPTTIDANGNPSLVNPKNPNSPIAEQEPSSLSGCNSLNPRNLPWARTHVYGSWPSATVRYVAEKLYIDDPVDQADLARQQEQITRNQIVRLGRIISTLADLAIIVLIFGMGWILAGRRVGLLAAGLYAFTAFAIQQSHFYTVDLQAAAYGTATLFFCLKLAHDTRRTLLFAVGAGICLGLAIASKINMVALALAGIVAAVQAAWKRTDQWEPDPLAPQVILSRLFWSFIHGFVLIVVAAIFALITVRFAMPDAFIGSTGWDLRPDPRFLEALGNAKVTASAELDFPPSHQFASRTPWLYDWKNMVVWGMGIPLGLAAWLGWLGLGIGMVRRASRHLLRWLPLWVWVSFYFWWQGGQPIKPMRYHLPIYGPLVLFAAWGLVAVLKWAFKEQRPLIFRRVRLGAMATSLIGLVVLVTVFWGWGYSRIFARPHPRIAASEWVKHNVPPGSVISADAWDIGVSHLDGNIWPSVQMPITDEDNPKKVEDLLNALDTVDYLAFTSNRAYGSLPQLPMRFPMSLNYFRGIFDESLGFEKVGDFSSYPSFLGIEFSDEWADESWSVYDHPRVTIWKKTPRYNRERAREILLKDVNIDEVYTLKPIDATPIPTMLQLSVERWAAQRGAASWSDTFTGWANQLPLVAWVVIIELLGLAGFGLLWRLRLPLPDRGLSMARLAALLALAFSAWFPPALGIWSYSRLWIGMVAVGILAGGGWSLWRERGAIREWVIQRRGALIANQVVYVAGFGLLLLIRILNPDLWHPAMGGEKPMNLAYLTATLKSQTFPPYDPWFAGGYMNYYYWGYVLVGTPMKLLGLDPTLGFNLALPVLYGMTAQLAAGIGYNLLSTARRVVQRLERRAIWIGVAAAIALMLLGNLAEVVLYVNGLRTLGNPTLSLSNPEHASQGLWLNGGAPFSDLIDGFKAKFDGKELPFRTEWPYWNATRVIPGTINEFPFFSYLYGDLHAHVIALPMTLLALLVLIALWRAKETSFRAVLGCAAALGFLVGALKATNTWDYPTYLVLSGVGVFLTVLRFDAEAPWKRRWLYFGAALGIWILAIKLPWMPYNRWFGTGKYDELGFVGTDTRMSVREWLVIYGLWFWALIPFVLIVIKRLWSRAAAIGTGIGLGVWWVIMWIVGTTITTPTTMAPQSNDQLNPLAKLVGFIANIGGSLVREPLRQHAAVILLFVPLFLVCGVSLIRALRRRLRRRELFPLVWLTTALGLLIFTEVIVLPGAGRMNIVFKFGYQAWTLLALASALAIPTLFGSGSRRINRAHPVYAWRLAWGIIAAVLTLGALLYPVAATAARVNDRAVADAPRGLDGMAWMDTATWTENTQFSLGPDAQAIRWIRANVGGTPIILEGVTSPYRWTTRIATWTGLPTIIGWDGHQAQQRAPAQANRIIDIRKQTVQKLYTSADPLELQRLLDLYGVELIYVGPLERAIYNGGNTLAFDQLVGRGQWNVVYDHDQVRIYERVGSAPFPASLPPDFHPGVPPQSPLKRITLTQQPEPFTSGSTTNDTPWIGQHQWAAILLWVLVFQGLGLLAWPLAALALRSHVVAAWGMSKIVGLLIVGWLVWFPSSLGMIGWERSTIWLGIAGLAGLGWLAGKQGGFQRIIKTWQTQRRLILITEAVFLTLFAALTWMRAANPDLWNPYWGGEKPFEFGFLNAIIRSGEMPPVDPFFSGGSINYYYYGLYLMALPMKLLGLDSAIGFNLAVAMVGALIGIGAWSLGLLFMRRLRVAVLMLFFVALAGNLATVIPVGTSTGIAGIIRGWQGCDQPLGINRPACSDLNAQSSLTAMISDAVQHGTLDGLSRRLGGGVPWFWGPSRVLAADNSSINEFPFWSILFADLHPHLIGLPIVLLVIGLTWEASRRRRRPWLALTLVALCLGALIAANAWDVPTLSLLVVLALASRGWFTDFPVRIKVLRTLAWSVVALAVVAFGVMLYAPFIGAYRAPVGGVWPIRIGSPLLPWLAIYGPFLIILTGWMLLKPQRKLAPRINLQPPSESGAADEISDDSPPSTATTIITHEISPPIPAQPAFRRWTHHWGTWLGIAVLALGVGQFALSNLGATGIVLAASVPIRIVLLLFIALIGLRLLKPRGTTTRWALLLALLGAAVALGIEGVFIRDHLSPPTWDSAPSNYERMNTVFKFGYQVWTLWAVAAAMVLPRLLERLRRQNHLAYALWLVPLALMGLSMALFPIFGTISRIGTRFDQFPAGLTLNGTEYMETARYTVDKTPITLADDRAAIEWLTSNVTGTRVLLQSEEEFYRTFGVRIAANTGLPTVVSALHSNEQRPGVYIDERIDDIRKIYSRNTSDAETIWLLNKYGVDFVYVGQLERRRDPEGVAKFANLQGLAQVFQHGSVTIYQTMPELPQLALRWRPDQPPVSDNTSPTDGSPELNAALERYEAEPSNAGYAFDAGRLLWQNGQGDRAAAILRSAADQHPTDIALHHMLGDVLIALGRFEEAIRAYQEAYDAGSTPENLNKLGTGYLSWAALDTSKLNTASRIFEQAIAEKPTLPDPYFHLGVTYQRQERVAEARTMYETYLQVAPQDGIWRELATIHLNELE